jgi:hypothetical protein
LAEGAGKQLYERSLMSETIKYTELVTITIQRLQKIWECGEGQLTIKITDESGKKKAKIEGGETERI